jgi:hypothetical protein
MTKERDPQPQETPEGGTGTALGQSGTPLPDLPDEVTPDEGSVPESMSWEATQAAQAAPYGERGQTSANINAR